MAVRKAISLILVLAILAAGGFYLLKAERDDNDRMRNLYTEVEPLEREREQLKQEMKDLETDYAVKKRDYGTVEILFTTMDAQIYTDVYPIMRERGVVGVLGISYSEFPAFYNKLTADNVTVLLNDGWGLCLMVDAPTGDFKSWYQQFSRYLDNYKLPAPTAVYFRNNSYDSSMDEALIASGIQTVVLDTSDGRSRTVTDVTGDLWFTGAMPWGYTGSAIDLELLGRTDASNLVLTLELTEIWDKTKNKNVESREKQSFISILDSWKELLYEEDPLQELDQIAPTPYIYIDTNDPEVLHELYLDTLTPEQQLLLSKFRSVNLDKALSLHRDAVKSAFKLDYLKDRQMREMEYRLEELNEQIRSVYDYYGVGMKEEAVSNS